MTRWDFAVDVGPLVERARSGDGPRTITEMVEAAGRAVDASRADGTLATWLDAHAGDLVGQQLLVASVHSQPDPEHDLPRVLRSWAAAAGDPTSAAAVAWLKEEHPGLLRAWLLTRVEALVGEQLGCVDRS